METSLVLALGVNETPLLRGCAISFLAYFVSWVIVQVHSGNIRVVSQTVLVQL